MMKHKFRKYIGNRGSALFMVISVMTALIVTCTAMYYSVVSSRKTQYAIFNQQQSYQSAVSVSESVLGAIFDGTDDSNKTGFADLRLAISQMSPGDTITTSDNGFSAFTADGSGEADEDQVGAYTIDITLLDTVNGYQLFDVMATTMVNGTESVVHQIVKLPVNTVTSTPTGTGGGGAPEALFTSSGFNPSNSYVGMGGMYTDVFYDTEYTVFMPYQEQHGTNADLQSMGNVSCSGSLEVYYRVSRMADGNDWAGVRPMTWSIRKDLILSNQSAVLPFPSEDQLKNSGYSDNWNRILVGGDLTVQSGAKGAQNVDIYVLGDLIINDADALSKSKNVRVFVSGMANISGDTSKMKIYTYNDGNWYQATGGSINVLSKEEVATTINNNTATIVYYDWNTRYENIPGIDNLITIDLNYSNKTVTLPWNAAPGVNVQGATITVNESARGTDGSNGGGHKIIIETGNDPDNVYTLKLKGNLDGGKTFSWSQLGGEDPIWVLVKGKGTVVFEVPDGVSYENRSNWTCVMHYDWYDKVECSQLNNRSDLRYIKEFIHWDCGDNCCETEVQILDQDEYLCETCGSEQYFITCTDHNLRRIVCPVCNAGFYNVKTGSDGKLYSYGMCENRLNQKVLASKKNGAAPTVNIYLVVCGPASDVNFNTTSSESFCSFWGYIYAPYTSMRFNASLSAGNRIEFMGGMAVADFNLSEYHAYIGVYPDKLPSEIMSDECKQYVLAGLDGKPWKQDVTV